MHVKVWYLFSFSALQFIVDNGVIACIDQGTIFPTCIYMQLCNKTAYSSSYNCIM